RDEAASAQLPQTGRLPPQRRNRSCPTRCRIAMRLRWDFQGRDFHNQDFRSHAASGMNPSRPPILRQAASHREEKAMYLNSTISRRRLLRVGAAGARAGLAMPYVALAAGDPIRVGILQPFSGGLEVLGQQGFQGAEMALLEANEAGGVLGGRMFEIVKADD